MKIEDVLDEVFSLVYYGGFDFDSVWNMPVKYRKYLLKKLSEVKQKEHKKQQSITNNIKKARKK